eukprot:m.18566 g.18566  ORF g.18566 m.18566 type:complete len:392 (-) comp12086_c1_seq1:99-1274(-)
MALTFMHPMKAIRGVLFLAWVLLSSIQTTVFCFLPAIGLHFVAPKTSLSIVRMLATPWFASGAILMQVFGITPVLQVVGGSVEDLVHDIPHLLVVSNHYCRLDWLFTWMIEVPLGWDERKVITLKDGLRQVPGIGWAMQALRYLFIKRNWAADKRTMEQYIQSLQRDGNISMLLFPEGTDASASSIQKSQSFATKNGLQLYKHVLHPRTTGFVHIFKTMANSDVPLAVWDLTIGYENMAPGTGEPMFIKGLWPTKVFFRVSRWPMDEMPKPEDTDGLSAWLNDRWSEKERRLEQFVLSESDNMELPLTKSRLKAEPPRVLPVPWRSWLICGGPLFILLNVVVFPMAMWHIWWCRYWFVLGCMFFVIVGKFFGGVDKYLTMNNSPTARNKDM